MTPSVAPEPHNNPCAQCGRPIARPVWSETVGCRVHHDWICQVCDYEFTTIAIYAERQDVEHAIAA
jgi:hypothetical protein